MKVLHTIGALCFIGCMMSCQSVKNKITEKSGIDSLASNPFITHMYTADPSAHVWEDGRLYIYASHDIDPPRGCDLMDRYHVFSTDDMVHWTDHGEILNSSQVAWGRKEGGFMWAPDCAYKMELIIFISRIRVKRLGMIPGKSEWQPVGILTEILKFKDI